MNQYIWYFAIALLVLYLLKKQRETFDVDEFDDPSYAQITLPFGQPTNKGDTKRGFQVQSKPRVVPFNSGSNLVPAPLNSLEPAPMEEYIQTVVAGSLGGKDSPYKPGYPVPFMFGALKAEQPLLTQHGPVEQTRRGFGSK
jgi:hypothetical protein